MQNVGYKKLGWNKQTTSRMINLNLKNLVNNKLNSSHYIYRVGSDNKEQS